MKTITLDDEAYARLKAWKRSPGDSFSKVVKRIVPDAGTLGAFLRFTEGAGTGLLRGNAVMESSIEERPSSKSDPWS